MRDRAGNELQIGDEVLYLEPGRSTSRLVWGVIVNFTPQMIVVKNRNNECRRHPSSVIKPFRRCAHE